MKKSKGKKETPRDKKRAWEKEELREVLEKLQQSQVELAKFEEQMSVLARWGEEPRSWSDRLKFFTATYLPLLSGFLIVVFGLVSLSAKTISVLFDISFNFLLPFIATVLVGGLSSVIAHLFLQFLPWGGFSKREGARLLAEVVKLRKEQEEILKKLKKG